MFRRCLFSLIIFAIFTNCVEPQNIELGGNSQWVVYGLIGENSAPIVFIYGVQNVNEGFIYNRSAKIEITDVSTGETVPLQPIINDTSMYYDLNEFPFSKDASGNIIYYSSPNFKAKAGATYDITFDLDEETGKATVNIPKHVNFSEVDIKENSNGDKILQMSIDVLERSQYYKWEVNIDQMIEYQTLSIDTISGDTIYDINSIYTKQTFLPEYYIDDEEISSNGNLFRFSLSNNLTDYSFVEDSYNVNVRLRHYGKEVVDYFQSIEAQSNAPVYDPFVEPVFIKSNIDGLIGLIGTFSYSPDLFLQYQP